MVLSAWFMVMLSWAMISVFDLLRISSLILCFSRSTSLGSEEDSEGNALKGVQTNESLGVESAAQRAESCLLSTGVQLRQISTRGNSHETR